MVGSAKGLRLSDGALELLDEFRPPANEEGYRDPDEKQGEQRDEPLGVAGYAEKEQRRRRKNEKRDEAGIVRDWNESEIDPDGELAADERTN